jgi:GNAT superfamily N-acetyltransferase
VNFLFLVPRSSSHPPPPHFFEVLLTWPLKLSFTFIHPIVKIIRPRAMDSLSILAMAAAAMQERESESLKSTAEFSIRRAQSWDIPLLEYVERSAADIFRTVNLGFLADGDTVDPAALRAMAQANHLWVATNNFDQPIGFVGGEYLSGNFHIVEISVAKEFQGKGVGKALMTTIVEHISREGYKSITLTTYRNLPWNGPWYSRLGFFEVNAHDMGRDYLDLLDSEAQHGLDVRSRCVMRKIL